MFTQLRITGRQRLDLHRHLFSGDGKEAVSIGTCGRLRGEHGHVLTLHKVMHIPHDECSVREPTRVTWSTKRLERLLVEAIESNHAIVKFHSHPGGFDRFSTIDDESDRTLFDSVHGWTDGDDPHASAVMLPSGRIFARAVQPDGSFQTISRVSVTGEDIAIYDAEEQKSKGAVAPEHDRHARCFGAATTTLMQRLAVGVVGCSGTGGPTVEMLSRLALGRLVIADPQPIGLENLNRIPNTTREDAERSILKVDAMARAVRAIGLATTVETIAANIADSPEAVRSLAECDVLFGCVDSAEGRHILNKIAIFYNIPYFDVGVKLEAGEGGRIDEVCGTVHYLTPDGSSLLDRGVYTMERVRAEGTRRSDPAAYAELVRDNYIQGVDETSPAVVSVNTFFAARMINEFLARIHPYRLEPNLEYAVVRESLSQMERYRKRDEDFPHTFAKHAGRGDVRPLLDMPALSERFGAI